MVRVVIFMPHQLLQTPRVWFPWLMALASPCLCSIVAQSPGKEGDAMGSWIPLQKPMSPDKVGLTWVEPSLHGIDFQNELSDAQAEKNRILENGSGVAAGDVNGDGRCDLYFATLQGPNRLYLNQGHWQFEEVPDAGGAACEDAPSTGVLLVDVDGDWDLDLLVNGLGQGTRLWMNDGEGRFTLSSESGLHAQGGPMSMSMADADGDGDLDLYVADYRAITWKDLPPGVSPKVDFRNGAPHAMPEDRFLAVDRGAGVKPGIIEVGLPDHLYLNMGGGVFQEQSWMEGRFLDEEGQTLTDIPRHWGLSVLFRDLNGDLLPDLLVCNDFGDGADQCWINQGKGIFRQLPNRSMRQSSWSSMAADVADINRDGMDDFLVVEMLSQSHTLRMTQRANEETGLRPPEMSMSLNRPQTQRNTLFVARGDGSFAELARLAGLDASEWSWGVAFADMDLDGWEDVLVCNGNNHDLLDGDATVAALQAMRSAPRGKVPRTLLLYPRLLSKNLIFRNQGNGLFEDTRGAWGFDQAGISQGLALADLDGDGDQDVLVNNLQAGPSLYRNDAGAGRIQVVLRGRAPNTAGVGARISLVSEKPSIWPNQSTVIVAGGRYLSSDSFAKTFAMPSDDGRFRLHVAWPSGEHTWIDSIRAGRRYEVVEPDPSEGATAEKSPKKIPANPVFRSSSSMGDRLQHVETATDAVMQWQPLLPRFIGRSGASLQVSDFNRDGLMDLAVGHGEGKATQILYQESQAHGLLPGVELPHSGQGDATDMVAWVSRDGVPHLALSVGNLSARLVASRDPRSQPSVLIYRFDQQVPTLTQSLTGQWAFPSCLELWDDDQDGDMDLFVGGGFHAGRFGEAATCRLFRNQQGSFELDLEQSRVWLGAGLITDAKAIDWDLDQDMDLLLSGEWGSLQLWEKGRDGYVNRTQELGLDVRKGMWMALEAADLDGDGDMDLIAGNWGRNTDYQKHLHHPIRLYHGDLDKDGRYDVLESYYDQSLKDWVPAGDLVALGNAFGFVRQRYRRYADVAALSMTELFDGISSLEQWLEMQHLESGIWWNESDHFQWQALPFAAQWAPIQSIAVMDWNDDGRPDIFLGQNYQSPQPAFSRMDAGLGCLIENLGERRFRCLSAEESGIRLFGEQSACQAADWNGDGRVDLIVGETAGSIGWFERMSGRQDAAAAP